MTTTERLRAATVATAANNGNESTELGEYGCLVGGRVCLEGTHREFLDDPQISHLYLGGTLAVA